MEYGKKPVISWKSWPHLFTKLPGIMVSEFFITHLGQQLQNTFKGLLDLMTQCRSRVKLTDAVLLVTFLKEKQNLYGPSKCPYSCMPRTSLATELIFCILLFSHWQKQPCIFLCINLQCISPCSLHCGPSEVKLVNLDWTQYLATSQILIRLATEVIHFHLPFLRGLLTL